MEDSNNDTPVSHTVTTSMPSTSKGPTKRKMALAGCILKYDRYFKTDCPEFTEESDFLKLQCRHCPQKIKVCNRSGSNLRTHYKSMHVSLFQEMCTSKEMTNIFYNIPNFK